MRPSAGSPAPIGREGGGQAGPPVSGSLSAFRMPYAIRELMPMSQQAGNAEGREA